jgi:hypothetical protein
VGEEYRHVGQMLAEGIGGTGQEEEGGAERKETEEEGGRCGEAGQRGGIGEREEGEEQEQLDCGYEEGCVNGDDVQGKGYWNANPGFGDF